jgi:integrase/recombinase XerD
MTSKRHTFTKTGHANGAISALNRFFDVLKKIIRMNLRFGRHTKIKSQLSNAEYHLTADQINKIINASASPRDWLMLQLLAETGLRRCEITAVRIEDFRLREFLLLVRHGKGNKARLVPLTPSFLNYLKSYINGRADGPLFVSTPDRPLSTRQINRIVSGAGERAGVNNPNPKYDRITPHLFRHSFARLWKDRGGSIEALSKIMGHQSTTTTWDLYGTLSLRDIQRDYRRVMKITATE